MGHDAETRMIDNRIKGAHAQFARASVVLGLGPA